MSTDEKSMKKLSPPKEFLEIKGGHNEGFMLSGDAYREGLESFLDDCVKRDIVPLKRYLKKALCDNPLFKNKI